MDPVLRKKAAQAFLTVLCPTALCVGAGAVARGTAVFTSRSGFFQLGVNAAIVGLLVLMARRWPTRLYVAAGTLITAVLAVAAARSGPRIVVHTIILMGMWVGVTWVNVKVLGLRRWGSILGPYVAWATVFAAGLFAAGAILVALFRPSDVRSSLLFYVELSVFTGIGLGMGFKVQVWLTTSLWNDPRRASDERE